MLGKCAQFTTSQACNVLDIFCSWCGTSQKCHVKGSVLNECLRADMKQMAIDGANQAANATKQFIADVKNDCRSYDGNMSACKIALECIPCEVGNTCFFIGDLQNTCVRAKVAEVVDKVTGAVKAVSEWAKDRYTNVENWGKSICADKYTDKDSCDAATQCTWCDVNTKCFIYSSYNNPCGNIQKGVTNVKNWWNGLWDKAKCETDKLSAYDALVKARDYTASNMKLACGEYEKSKLYTQKFVTALNMYRSQNISALVDVQIAMAQQTLQDAVKSIDESSNQSAMMTAYEESNPCVKTDKEASGSATLALPFVGFGGGVVLSACSALLAAA